MPVFEDWLREPLAIINNIFASDPMNFDSKVQEYFENKLKSEKNYFSIPCLNEVPIHELTPNCLVRYRCMIQDSFDPIYYYPVNQIRYKHSNDSQYVTFKYKEVLDSEEFELCNRPSGLKPEPTNDPKANFLKNETQNLQQRMTFYCVPIPGESEWVKSTYKSFSSQSSTNCNGSSSNTSHRPSKRAIDLTNEKSEQIIAETERLELNGHSNITDENNTNDCGNKKTKTQDVEENKVNSNNDVTLNFPLSSNETGMPCLVKVYENFDSYKINDMVEFIGILSQDPSLAYMHDENGDSVYQNATDQQFTKRIERNDEMETDQPDSNDKKVVLSSFPPSLVPRLNCIKSYRLIHNNPLLDRTKLSVLNNEETEKSKQNEYWNIQMRSFLTNLISESNKEQNNCKLTPSPVVDSALIENSKIYFLKLRQELVNCFQEILLGDGLAAEYLLMHLLSTVFMRKDVTVLGKFSLNLANVPQAFSNTQQNQNFVSSFYKAIKQFVSMSHLFPLTVENLNKANLIPSKDYVKDKLISGMLQLPQTFQLVIDETDLSSGELKEKGLMNVTSLKDIIQWQKLNYDFSYHQQEFQSNVRVLVLSQTKSILPFDCQLKLKTTVECLDSLETYENYILNLIESKNLLDNFRKYFCVLSKQDYKLPESLQKIVEDDIVNIRKSFSAANTNTDTSNERVISIEDIHLLLTVARLQCLSYGKSELSINEWNKAKTLEFERLHTRL